jgi:predicted O-methyltransferase YrrM
MKRAIKKLLTKAPFFQNLEKNIRNLEENVRRQGAYPVGHYYSPIPSQEDVLAYLSTRKPPNKELIGINLNEQMQYDLLNEYAQFYNDLPFPEEQVSSSRYYYNNSWFSYSDAIFLYCFLRKYQPKRIIEVGSGFSSAVMLDTIDSVFSQKPEITFIEPYPDRLNSLLRESDRQQIKLIDRKIQEVPSDIFSTLQSGDLLFIDSSHVVKCGSDLQLLLFEILPHIQPGVIVHFHDVFYPFDYPAEWLTEGRYWNENYFLRAFLAYNCQWSILFFNTYAHYMFNDTIQEKMPLCIKNPGGSLYIQRNPQS